MEIKLIGVVGAGQMGSGIAEVVITSGFDVLMRDINNEAVEKGKRRIASDLERRVQKGRMSSDEKEAFLKRLSTTTRLDDLKETFSSKLKAITWNFSPGSESSLFKTQARFVNKKLQTSGH